MANWAYRLSPETLEVAERWLLIGMVVLGLLSLVCGALAAKAAGWRANLLEEAAKEKISDLEAKTTPRLLSAEQKGILVADLAPRKGTKIHVSGTLGDVESMRFALDLSDALTSAGWIIEDGGVTQWGIVPVYALSVAKNAPSHDGVAEALIGALRRAGIKVDAAGVDQQALGPLHLVVGSKR